MDTTSRSVLGLHTLGNAQSLGCDETRATLSMTTAKQVTKRNHAWLKTLLHISWLALGLAVLLELLAFAVDTSLGQADSLAEFALGLTKKVAWSLPLCAALAVVAQRGSIMGITGIFAAPFASLFSGLIDSQFRELFMTVATDALTLKALSMAAFRGLEYGLLGALIGYLVERQRGNLRNHCLIGLLVGSVFGLTVVYLQLQVPYSHVGETVLQNMSEFIFPLGCSVILKVVSVLESA